MNIGKMTCPECGCRSFLISWKWENQNELNQLTLCHDGFGFQYEDAEIECANCHKKDLEWDCQTNDTQAKKEANEKIILTCDACGIIYGEKGLIHYEHPINPELPEIKGFCKGKFTPMTYVLKEKTKEADKK